MRIGIASCLLSIIAGCHTQPARDPVCPGSSDAVLDRDAFQLRLVREVMTGPGAFEHQLIPDWARTHPVLVGGWGDEGLVTYLLVQSTMPLDDAACIEVRVTAVVGDAPPVELRLSSRGTLHAWPPSGPVPDGPPHALVVQIVLPLTDLLDRQTSDLPDVSLLFDVRVDGVQGFGGTMLDLCRDIDCRPLSV